MVVPKYIDEILNEVQYGNDKKSSCRMEEVETRFRCFLTLDEWSHMNDLIDHVYRDMYISRYVLCSKYYEHIPE